MADKKPDYYAGPQAGDFAKMSEPFGLFEAWLADATAHEPNDANAMSLASVDANGLPNIRMVLLKALDSAAHPARGFVFYTNFDSAKGSELLKQPKAAACFHWKSLRRQIRIRGLVSVVTDAEADAYFGTRPRGSQIGAWASRQSRALESRFALEKAVAGYAAKFNVGRVPRPAHWSGFRLSPLEIEFWHDRPFRLHERVLFRRPDVKAHTEVTAIPQLNANTEAVANSEEGTNWTKSMLYP